MELFVSVLQLVAMVAMFFMINDMVKGCVKDDSDRKSIMFYVAMFGLICL